MNFSNVLIFLLGLFYLICFPLIVSVLFFFFLFKKIDFTHFKGKLGFFPKRFSHEGPSPKADGLKTPIWVHCSSLGEWHTVKKLVWELERRLDKTQNHKILITYFNQDGEEIKKRHPNLIGFFLPLENPFAFASIVKTYQVKTVIITETELWPILIFSLKALKVKMFLVNATLFDREINRYRRFFILFRALIKSLDYIFVSSEKSQKNFLLLGAKRNQIQLTGNLKLDITLPKMKRPQKVKFDLFDKNRPKKFTLVWASFHLEEIKVLQDSLRHLMEHPRYRIVLVPRDMVEVNPILEVLGEGALERITTKIKSKKKSLQKKPFKNILWDCYGDLVEIYYFADLVIMGGSFASIGGHNFIEPMAQGRMVMLGPSYFHFLEMVDLFREELIMVDQENLLSQIDHFFREKKHLTLNQGRSKLLPFQNLSRQIADQIVDRLKPFSI